MSRIASLPLILRVGLVLVAGSLGFWQRAQAEGTYHLDCSNDYFPPLIAFDLPCYAQELNCKITILTDPHTPIGSHGVTVFNVNKGLFIGKPFNFNVGNGGIVTPAQGGTNTIGGGVVGGTSSPPSAEGAPPCYSSVVGTITFQGDNFPIWFWSFYTPDYTFPLVVDYRRFLLDAGSSTTAPPNRSDDITINSEYHYKTWAWSSWLGWEWPYLPGAAPYAPQNTDITFDLRGSCKGTGKPGPCESCGCAGGGGKAGSSTGMAVATLDRYQAGVKIADTPISYTPSLGMTMAFSVNYEQRRLGQSAQPICSNLGTQWQNNWISYISGGPTNADSAATFHDPDGSQYVYGGYQHTPEQGPSDQNVNSGDFTDNEGWTHATLHYRQNPERYERWLPDGTVETYAWSINTSQGRLFFLSFITDPRGLVTTLTYDPVAQGQGHAVITSVTDPVGGQLVFSYNPEAPLQIAKVTRSCDGLFASFQYTNGQLSSITDTIGMTSSFQYAPGTPFVSEMTTPYGNSTFNSVDGTGFLEADITNPLGQKERVEYQESVPSADIPDAGATPPSATGLTTDATTLTTANSFYWDRRAMADATAGSITVDSTAFYGLADINHWAETRVGSIPVLLSKKKRLEARVWYNYPDQSNVDYVMTNATTSSTGISASTSPSVTARVLDGGAVQVSYASYNANGLITQSIDPIGRTTNYSYDTTYGIDLTEVTQVNGTGQDILSQMTYNGQHEPLTSTDASGQLTKMTYNAYGQMLTRTDPLNETTTMVYDTNNFLHTVTGAIPGAITTYTYDAVGRMQTVKDSEGYLLTYGYDNLDRPTSITYPDGTTDLTYYHNLDVSKTIDRQGRATTNQYDLIRELLQTTDPLGRTTKYTWCTCGGLATLTDANGNVTTWGLDGEGRVTSKTYADSSAINYLYETNTSRLHTMTDALGSVTTYAYNNDNTLASTTYSPATGVAATHNVSFAYDSVYNRVTSMTDLTGTTSYYYNNVYTSGSPVLGGGRLNHATVPIYGTGSSATVNFTYDALGRATNRNVDSANSVTTSFDALGRVTGVVNLLGTFGYSYVDQTSRLSSVTYPTGTGLVTNYSYYPNAATDSTGDGDQRLQEIKNMSGSSVLSKFDYTYNPVGTIATWQQQADSGTPNLYTLSYDAADQLTDAELTSSGSTVASNKYNYDPAGNRLAETTLSGTTGGQFNNLNQLTALGGATSTTVAGNTSMSSGSVTVNAVAATIDTTGTNFSASVQLPNGTNTLSIVAHPTDTNSPTATQRVQLVTTGTAPTSLTYDANGNTHTDENGNTYKWDVLNRLVEIDYPSAAKSLFAYDGLSRRIQIVEEDSTGTVTSTKNFLWIGSAIAEERNASNTAVTKRFFPQGEQQTISGTASSYYYTRDHLGSTRELVDGSGNLLSRYSYDPYGRVTATHTSTNTSTPPIDATFQYTGDYVHQVSGLNLTLYRVYDPNTSRWLSRDPLENAEQKQGPNLYCYVGNSPFDQTDVLGLETSGPATSSTVSSSKDSSYLTFTISCPKCSKVDKNSVRIDYNDTQMYKDMSVDPTSMANALKQGDNEAGFGGLKSISGINCQGNPVTVLAWMRTRLVASGWLYWGWREYNGAPDPQKMLGYYKKNTRVIYNCVPCQKGEQ